MTDKELKEKILAEIERLRKKNEVFDDKEYAQYELDVSCGYDSALEDILSFVNSLPEEPVSEELEEASMSYAQEVIRQSVKVLREQYKERYGLDLGEAIVSPDLDKEIANHFKKGAQWQKERMLIKACEFIRTPNIYVVDFNHYGGATTNYEATVEKFKKFMEENK